MKGDGLDFWFTMLLAALVFLVTMLTGYSIGYVQGRDYGKTLADTVTVRLPPDPDFIEAFRLECKWIPREGAR